MKGEKVSRRVLTLVKKGENFLHDSPHRESPPDSNSPEDTQYLGGPDTHDFSRIVDSISNMNVHAESRCNAETTSRTSSRPASGSPFESHRGTDSETALDSSEYDANLNDAEYYTSRTSSLPDALSTGRSNLEDALENLPSSPVSSGNAESTRNSAQSGKLSPSSPNRYACDTYYQQRSPPPSEQQAGPRLPQGGPRSGSPVKFDIFTPNTASDLNFADANSHNSTGCVDEYENYYKQTHEAEVDDADNSKPEYKASENSGDGLYYGEKQFTSGEGSQASHDDSLASHEDTLASHEDSLPLHQDKSSDSNENKSLGSDSGSCNHTEKSSASNDSSASYNVNVSESEDSKSYAPGGYHPVHVGEVYNERYKVEAKLGWGYFSTVWLASDLASQPDTFVALKFQRSAKIYTDAVYDEIEMLTEVNQGQTSSEWVSTGASYSRMLAHNYNPTNGVVAYLDNFTVSGPNGHHICVVFEVMGPNLLTLIKFYKFQGIPIPLVKKITAHVLLGLDYLHRVCKIIHTDLKPENILITSPLNLGRHAGEAAGRAAAPSKERAGRVEERAKGRAHQEEALNEAPGTREVRREGGAKPGRSLEVEFVRSLIRPSISDPTMATSYEDHYALQEAFMRRPYHHVTWNMMKSVDRAANRAHYHPSILPCTGAAPFGAAKTKIRTSRGLVQIRPYTLEHFNDEHAVFKICDLGNACWIDRHFTEEIQTRQYRAPEAILNIGYDNLADIWSLACVVFELVTGDYLFDPYGKESIKRDSNHLLLIVELLGPIPNYMIQESKKSKKLSFDEINRIKRWPLESVLVKKYKMDRKEAAELANFLSCMLRINPSERQTAQHLLSHRWLTSS